MPKKLFTNKHYNTPGHAHELTYSTYKRRPYFQDPIPCRLFLDNIRKAQIKFNLHLWAYVIMPNHVHFLIWFKEDDYDIAKVLQAINGTMSRRYSRLLKRIESEKHKTFQVTSGKRTTFRFWQRGGGFDRNLYNYKSVHASIHYIENNPVRQKLVSVASEYCWSSAYNNDLSDKWRPAVDRSAVPVKMDALY